MIKIRAPALTDEHFHKPHQTGPMLLSVFGTPSALMHGGLNVVRRITDIALGSHEFINANKPNDLREAFAGLMVRENAKVVFCSDMPNTELCELFIKTAAPIVLFIDSFDDIVANLKISKGASVIEGARSASRSICALETIIRSDQVFKIDSKAYHRSLTDIVSDIGEFFNARLTPAKIAEIISALGVKDSTSTSLSDYLLRTFPKLLPPGRGIEQLTIDERQIVDQLAGGYSAIAARHSLIKIDWPVSVMIDASAPDKIFTGRIELVGPARFLAYGPYLHLTRGLWRADIEFEIYDNLSGNQLCVDIYVGTLLAAAIAPLPASGRYQLQVSFKITDPSFEPVELRFQLTSGAIEGVIDLTRITLNLIEGD